MSSFSIRTIEKEQKNEGGQENENEEDDEEDSSMMENEEADQLLLSYRKNSLRQKRSSMDESVQNDIPRPPITDNYETSMDENWLSDESIYSTSDCLLRDLLPHLTEPNANVFSQYQPSMILTKTYTEPNSLSGLLKQVGNRLLSHYPSRVVKRHSKISPATSMHCKLDDAACQPQTAPLSAESTLRDAQSDTIGLDIQIMDKQTLDNQTLDNYILEHQSLENMVLQNYKQDEHGQNLNLDTQMLVYQTLDNHVLESQSLDRHRTRFPTKTPLCKRCPHCKKTCFLRKTSTPETLLVQANQRPANYGPNLCSCRICKILESVESSPVVNAAGNQLCQGPNSSNTSVNLNTFSSNEYPHSGISGPRQASLSDVSLDYGLFCNDYNISTNQFHEWSKLDGSYSQQQTTPQESVESKSREQGIQVNSSSMISIATTSSFGGPVCRICHSPGDKLEPLISPCRCLGTLKYVHASCLLHWLEISSRKLRRPPHCELCGYRYQRHKTMKLRRIQWPNCNRRDKMYHALFFISVLMMVACAAVTIMCFKADRGQVRTTDDGTIVKKATSGGTAAVSAAGNGHVELSGQEVVTLVCGILFFCAFFLAMYVQVKAQTTVYKLFVRFWSINQEWRVDEYRKEKDAEYWRQRHEQQKLQLQQQQQQRRLSAQISLASGNGILQPLIHQQQIPRISPSSSNSSSISFPVDNLNVIN